MNLYLDASALVKRYIREPGTAEVEEVVRVAQSVATSLITRVEVSSSFAKAVRMRVISEHIARNQLALFRNDWGSIASLNVTQAVAELAEGYAGDFGLRAYDAVHLASAVVWQDNMGGRVTLATFDRALWEAAKRVSLTAFPGDLPGFIASLEGRS